VIDTFIIRQFVALGSDKSREVILPEVIPERAIFSAENKIRDN